MKKDKHMSEEKLNRAIDGLTIQAKALAARKEMMKAQIFELQAGLERKEKRIKDIEARIAEYCEQLYQLRTKKIE